MPGTKVPGYEGKSISSNPRVRTTTRTNDPATSTAKTRTKLKVLVAHYAGIICHGICSIIDDTDDFEVCGRTDDEERARQLFQFHRPRVVVVGRAIGGHDGLTFIKQLHKFDPKAAILMLCADEDAESVHRVWRAGALGYLRPFDPAEELVTAMRKITAGERYLSERLRQAVFRRVATWTGKSSGASTDKLTDRERQVLFHIGKGAILSEIARQMGVSTRTVEEFQRRIKVKLGANSMAELRAKAARWANKCDWQRAEHSGSKGLG